MSSGIAHRFVPVFALVILGAASAAHGQAGGVGGWIVGVTPGEAGGGGGGGEALLAGAEVFLYPGAGTPGKRVTGEDGFYLFQGLAPGLYAVAAVAEGFELRYGTVEVQAGGIEVLNLVLPSLTPCDTCPMRDVTEAVGLADARIGSGDGHGPGAVFTDLDRDGSPDLYLMRSRGPGGARNLLYLNRPASGGGREFIRAPNDAGAGNPGNATGAVAADYDNDGDVDLYVLNFDQPNALLRNLLVETGSLEFEDVTSQTDPTPGVPDRQFGVGIAYFEGVALDNSLTAAWADVDRDGDLDLYVGNHNGFFGSEVEGPFGVPGRRDVLYRNEGDGTFTDVTMEAHAPGWISEDGRFMTADQRFSSTNAVVFADFNNDLWPDLLVTNKIGGPDDRDMLYLNLGEDAGGAWQGFAPATYDLVPRFGDASGAAMGVDAGDFDNDGDIDIYITDFSGPAALPGENDLWVNRLADTGSLGFVLSGAAPAEFSWGTRFQDFDHDGRLDLHVATDYGRRDYLYLNGGSELFEVAVEAGVAQVRNSRGDVAADFDLDGWSDLLVVNLDQGPPTLYRNALGGVFPWNRFLTLRLAGRPDLPGPHRTSRDAVGARVRVSADLDGDGSVGPGEIQIREVVSGSGNAASTSSLALEFGLGAAPSAKVEIFWPSGRTSVFQAGADQFLDLTEPGP